MFGPRQLQATGAAIAAIGTAGLPAALAEVLRGVAPFSHVVAFGYHGAAPPMDLYDDFPADKRRIFVTDYQEGPYLLDPFFLAATRPVAPGLYRLRDLAPDRFYQSEYFRTYYIRTGLAEEIGYFVDLPGGVTIVLSLMRTERVFAAREFQNLAQLCAIVEACLRQHWSGLAARLPDDPVKDPQDATPQRLARSFHTFGQDVLTPRERQIVELTLKGHSAVAVGQILSIAAGTVRIHRRNIYDKLGISSQGELFSRFIGTLG